MSTRAGAGRRRYRGEGQYQKKGGPDPPDQQGRSTRQEVWCAGPWATAALSPVALNLAGPTPEVAAQAGAAADEARLDLSGGVCFLLEVDMVSGDAA